MRIDGKSEEQSVADGKLYCRFQIALHELVFDNFRETA